ncbi:uncharacterized protein LOC124112758 [Haliotis rufescens]|uniref:uncharacterized protein LOC124112758 n=1 Tax=Haliotis rufescens TaxID=6454 RepID=UPI001EB03C9D|nr:uncharacterized protein LOC124112758 [Haliotis rufescens]
MSVPGEPVETKMGLLSIKGAATAITFFLGLGMFLMAFASTEWLGLDEGISISLWKSCSKDYKTQVWTCVAWDVLPDFVRAAQGFCVVGILTYALSLMILVAYITVPTLQETRGVLIALCLLIFSAGCMTLMALIVMGIKGKDFCVDIRRDISKLLHYFALRVNAYGSFYIGWSYVIAILSSIVTLSSFAFCMLEFIRVNDMPVRQH